MAGIVAEFDTRAGVSPFVPSEKVASWSPNSAESCATSAAAARYGAAGDCRQLWRTRALPGAVEIHVFVHILPVYATCDTCLVKGRA